MISLIWILRIFCAISVFQILLISFYIFIKKKGSAENRFLISSLLIVWAIFITGSLILLVPSLRLITYDTGHLMNLSIFLVAPILYIHFSALFKAGYKFSSKDLVHAIPFLLILAYLFNEIVIQGRTYYVFTPMAIFLISLLIVQNIIYFFLILKDIKTLPVNESNKSKLNLYRTLFLSALVLFFLKLIIFISWYVLRYTQICILLTDIFFIAVFIIINVIVIFSLNNPYVIIGAFKYQGSPISKEESAEYLIRINSCLSGNKIYTDPLISLERLAKNLKIPERLLSQIINQESGLNFNDYINKYRVNQALEMIKSASDKKVLEIAYECGFNSKTTFNTAFKKFTGLTPSQFKKNTLTQQS